MDDREYDDDGFYAAIGRAVTCWADVEDGLFILFHALLNTDNKAAAAVFFAMSGFERRLRATTALVGVRCDPGGEGLYWQQLEKAAKSLAEQRNILAHSPVNANLYLDDDGVINVGELAVSASRTKVTLTGATDYSRPVETIEPLYLAFSVLLQELTEFSAHLSGRSPSADRFRVPVLPDPLGSYLPRNSTPRHAHK